MESYNKNLGRAAIKCEDEHNSEKSYHKYSIVYKIINNEYYSFISRKYVPKSISIDNEEYWQPIGLTLEYI